MKRIFILTSLLLTIAGFVLVQAQQTVGVASNPLGGPISASSANCSVAQACVWMRIPFNAGSISVSVNGTFSETLQVEESNDGGNTFFNVATLSSVGITTYEIAGMSDFRIRCSSFVSGIAFINMQASLAAGAAYAFTDGVSSATIPSFGNFAFNGSTWDRVGYCPNFITLTQAASSTVQLVALSAGTKIRVCTFFLNSLNINTAAFVTGTGSNCAAGQTSLTGTMNFIAAGTIVVPIGGSGSYSFIVPSAQALCLTTGIGIGGTTGGLMWGQW
jgi:hypothetical protein